MRVYILGVPYEIERGYVIGKDMGCVDHVKQNIVIDDDLEYDSTVETLLHEIMHCIEYAFGMDIPDRHIECLARGLYSVLQDPQNEAFWATLAGSDEIMGGNDVDCNTPEVLEGICPGCNCDWSMCNCWSSQAPVEYEREFHRAFNKQVGALSDAECWPRRDDPEAEPSRKRFAESVRATKDTIRGATVTTTQDHLPRQNHGDPNYFDW